VKLEYDTVIVGAGPAGSTMAALLAQRGESVLLCDAARFPRPKPCAEFISPGGVTILRSLGVFEYLDVRQTGRWLDGMRIVGASGKSHTVTYHQPPGALRQRGLSVSRCALDAALLEVARTRGAEVREGFRIREVERSRGRVSGIIGPDGTRISARLVVGADGLNSVVARQLGLSRRLVWPRRLGLVAHFQNVAWPEDTGVMFVGPRSYVGVAPLDAAGRLSVGLVRNMPRGRLGSPRAALESGLRDFPPLQARLTSACWTGTVRGVGPLARTVRACAGPGFMLIGDAAGFFDPFTGEGIFRALRSAQLAVEHQADYTAARQAAFAAKERLTRVVQVVVRAPVLLELALRRLEQRPSVAGRLGNMLGDLEPAEPGIAWQLLGP
jgi:geranylgeranyl reductase family protein